LLPAVGPTVGAAVDPDAKPGLEPDVEPASERLKSRPAAVRSDVADEAEALTETGPEDALSRLSLAWAGPEDALIPGAGAAGLAEDGVAGVEFAGFVEV
jgi:hypothetical protein